jgi:NAD+ diphosphatase
MAARRIGDDRQAHTHSRRMPFIPASQPTSTATPHAWCFAFIGRDLLQPMEPDASLQPLDPAALTDAASARHYLGTLGAVDCWAMSLVAPLPGWRVVPLRAAMLGMTPAMAALAGRAAQIIEWDRSHRHCGVCGTLTELQPGERARICPACRHTAYPRLSPAMMALVWRPGELLLARAPHYAAGMYSALAGFVEAGESLEDCVHREVAEEVAVTVDSLRYFGSQSWPFPHSLMVAYTARWTAGEIVPQASEIEHAAWFPLDALPGIPPRFSIAGHLIRDTVDAMRAGVLA